VMQTAYPTLSDPVIFRPLSLILLPLRLSRPWV